VVAWSWLNLFPRPEGAVFPGITAALLIAVSFAVVRVRGITLPPLRRRLHQWLGGAALLFGVAALAAWLAPWKTTVFGLLISNTHVENPLRFSLLFFGGWLLSSPGMAAAFRHRSALGGYLVGAALMWMLGLGPSPALFGDRTPLPGPYALLLNLPGFDSIRVPSRFAMLTALCLACAGALALARLAVKLPRPTRFALVTVAGVLALADGWTRLGIEPLPKPWAIQKSLAPEPMIELPFGEQFSEIQAVHRSMFAASPIVNGFSGNFPPWYQPLRGLLDRYDPQALEELSAIGVRQVVVDTTHEDMRPWLTYFATRPDIGLAADDGTHRLYRLPAAPRPSEPRAFGTALSAAAISATVDPEGVPEMTDGDLTTRWHSWLQKGNEMVTIDLGTSQRVGAIVLEMGRFSTDAPRDLLVEVSDNRVQWGQIWRGAGEPGVFRGALRDFRRVPLTIDIGDRPARFIRLSQLGTNRNWYWSIAELTILAAR
jgi:hypothetical protein